MALKMDAPRGGQGVEEERIVRLYSLSPSLDAPTSVQTAHLTLCIRVNGWYDVFQRVRHIRARRPVQHREQAQCAASTGP